MPYQLGVRGKERPFKQHITVEKKKVKEQV
jgi:2'-5' RNA ligase